MLRPIAIAVFLLIPLIACAQTRLAPGEAGSVPRMGEEQPAAIEEPVEPETLPVTPPPATVPMAPVISPVPTVTPAPVLPQRPAAPLQPPASVPGQAPVVSSPPAAGVQQPVMPDMTPNCMRPAELIGKPQSDIGTVQFTNPTRILSPGSAATMDYSPNRTNIILDAQGIIREMTCG